MKFQNLMLAMQLARVNNLNTTDIFILNEVFCADNNTTTVMKIVEQKFASHVTIHNHLKKLCKAGFLIKKEHPKNMRFKSVEPGEEFVTFLRKLGEIE